MPDTETPILICDLSWSEEGGDRLIRGCASVPKVDQENEIVVTDAISAALSDFMALPVLHLDHTERPIGLVTKAEIDNSGSLQIEAKIKPTECCNDVWDRIRAGDLTQFSIYGRRREGSNSCRLRPEHRTEPCTTSKLFLDSISICPKNMAINEDTFLEIVKGIVVKSMNSASALIHSTADGVTKSDTMEDEPIQPDSGATEQSAMSSVLQQILDHVSELGDRLDDLEDRVSSPEPTSAPAPEPDDLPPDEGEEYEPGPDEGEGMADDEDIEKAGGNGADMDIGDMVQTIGEALQYMMRAVQEIAGDIQEMKSAMGNTVQKAELEEEDKEEYPDDGYEDEEYPEEEPEEEEEDIEKRSDIRKAKMESDLEALKDQITTLEHERTELLKKARPRDPVVIVPEHTGENVKTKNKETNPVSFVTKMLGGV